MSVLSRAGIWRDVGMIAVALLAIPMFVPPVGRAVKRLLDSVGIPSSAYVQALVLLAVLSIVMMFSLIHTTDEAPAE